MPMQGFSPLRRLALIRALDEHPQFTGWEIRGNVPTDSGFSVVLYSPHRAMRVECRPNNIGIPWVYVALWNGASEAILGDYAAAAYTGETWASVVADDAAAALVRLLSAHQPAEPHHTHDVHAFVGSDPMIREAIFSDCQRYRYRLYRCWKPLFPDPPVLFIGINPSTADDADDDPTSRRMVHFARAIGCGSLYVVNLFGFITKHPPELRQQADPVGPGNDAALTAAVREVVGLGGLVIACWGVGRTPARVRQVVALVAEAGGALHALKVGIHGDPLHPLYLSNSCRPTPWPPES